MVKVIPIKRYKDIDLTTGTLVEYNGGYYKSLGVIKNKSEVPENTRCIYKLADRMYVQTVDLKKYIDVEININENKETRLDNNILDTEIKQDDNELMVMIKELLKGMTIGTFKKLFPADKLSEMYNMKRCIEQGTNLSIDRFSWLVHAMNLHYQITITNMYNIHKQLPFYTIDKVDSVDFLMDVEPSGFYNYKY